MDILSSVTTWIAFIILQTTPVNEMTTYSSITYMSGEMVIEIQVDDIPAENYWNISTEIVSLENEKLLARFESGGFFDGQQNQLFSLKEGLDKNSFPLYSVNDTGTPLTLSLDPGPGTRIYISSDYFLPYKGLEIFEFKGGKDYIHRYSDGDMDVYITEKFYQGNDKGSVTNFAIELEEAGIDISFYIYYANEG